MLDVARLVVRTARVAGAVVRHAPIASVSLSFLALARLAVAVSPRPRQDGVHPDWQPAGEVLVGPRGSLTFPALPRDAGVWLLSVLEQPDARVGDADDLASALPRAARATALRRWISEHLIAGRTVLVAVACTATLRASGAEAPVDLSLESVRSLATAAARDRLPTVEPAAAEASSRSEGVA